MRLFDLHADTPFRMFAERLDFSSDKLHISSKHFSCFENYTQVFAVFSDNRKSDTEVLSDFFSICKYFRRQLAALDTPPRYCLSLEDARLLCGREENLYAIKEEGIALMTPLWRGSTHIGGAFDTNEGLTPFGKAVVGRACNLGIIPDISHASPQSADDILAISSKNGLPCVATHSDSYGVTPHPRNIRDTHFRAIVQSGGLIGISLAPQHLSLSGTAQISDILRHIEYGLSLGGEDSLALGCDLDGVSSLPCGIRSLGDIHLIAKELAHHYDSKLADKILYQNAASFFERHQLTIKTP